WGNHEGSMLLWVLMMAAWGYAVTRARNHLGLSLVARLLSIQGALIFGFLVFMLLTSNPFARLSPPAPEGLGLNPMLQDIALALHPPLLYAGYVGFSVVFCFGFAALLER